MISRTRMLDCAPNVVVLILVSLSCWQGTSCGQSSVIEMPRSNSEGHSEDFGIRNSLPGRVFALEAKMMETRPPHLRGELSVQQLADSLNSIGVVTLIDRLNVGDVIDLHDPSISLPHRNATLATCLRFALAEHELVWTIVPQAVVITTADAQYDPGFQLAVTYDVSVLGMEMIDVMDAVSISVDPDSWEDAGGPNRLYGFAADGNELLTVTADYAHQKMVRDYFASLMKLKGNGGGVQAAPDSRLASSPIAMPMRSPKRGMTLPGSNTYSGFGGGGLGGGVFDVPDRFSVPHK